MDGQLKINPDIYFPVHPSVLKTIFRRHLVELQVLYWNRIFENKFIIITLPEVRLLSTASKRTPLFFAITSICVSFKNISDSLVYIYSTKKLSNIRQFFSNAWLDQTFIFYIRLHRRSAVFLPYPIWGNQTYFCCNSEGSPLLFRMDDAWRPKFAEPDFDESARANKFRNVLSYFVLYFLKAWAQSYWWLH